MIRIIYEDSEVAVIREKLKNLNNRQLKMLEEIIQREKKRRQKAVFDEWLHELKEQISTDNGIE